MASDVDLLAADSKYLPRYESDQHRARLKEIPSEVVSSQQTMEYEVYACKIRHVGREGDEDIHVC